MATSGGLRPFGCAPAQGAVPRYDVTIAYLADDQSKRRQNRREKLTLSSPDAGGIGESEARAYVPS